MILVCECFQGQRIHVGYARILSTRSNIKSHDLDIIYVGRHWTTTTAIYIPYMFKQIHYSKMTLTVIKQLDT